ncbi:M20/M25/M40 family metallo-hydrolase [Bacillus sp. CGMCC 1.16541]|uniref:M20/M25/M40 family metallo-hydrolase n=1 Tax=Bacillus sp. CGMCC 1.16541 TaxID=2185143 RepID=UPI000D734122|nr:M20/M25/M40 family metallo-hydrolase [Bacillus sp. CGMCC 1.16541]
MKKASILVAVIFTMLCASVASAHGPIKGKQSGQVAYKHMAYISETIGTRVMGTEKEKETSEYIQRKLRKLGYDTEVQPFTFTRKGTSISSENVIATKKGKSKKELIVGAHYDSVATAKGADDNASSVGVILETAKALQKKKTPYTIKFVLFGAEEGGLNGSNYYVSQMSEKEKNNTVAMINLDSLVAGDYMYVYGSKEEKGWVRDHALKIADKKKLDLTTNPGVNPEYPKGTTGDWSDHAPFEKAGIPIAYFEATNWEIGDQDGYTQTVKHGAIWHTEKDNISFLEKEFPGRIEERLHTFTTVLTELLVSVKKEK